MGIEKGQKMMNQSEILNTGKIGRRDFLKKGALGTAAIGLSGSLSGMAAKEFASRTEKIPHASHGGPFHAHVRDGKIVDITAQLDSDANPTVMVKGLADRVMTPSRVKYPVVRKSYLEGKRKGELSGKEALYNSAYSGWAHPGAFKPNALAGRFFNQI